MGSSSSTHMDPAIKDLFPQNGPEPDELIHSFYTGKSLVKNYAAYRPKYPQDIFRNILKYHTEVISNDQQLAVDVCCGTGQSSVPLVQHFTKVVGIDVSEDQVSNMPKDIPNLTSHVALAEDMSMIESGTVDLVTIGTGLHWVNHEKFLKEAKRILKPGGTFAAYTWVMDQLDNEEANTYYREVFAMFKEHMTSKPFAAVEKYKSIEFPFDDIKRIDFETREEMSIEQFMGILQSIHIIKLFYAANPGTNVLEEIEQRMTSLLKTEDNSVFGVTVKMTKYYFLLLGRNK